ncbi:MAG: hypothetical protein IGQ88_05940 [Gloeomargaritaceae cyanobacterium C42_A2020_066]|nr:hypothetical protein [Gloeomargaritaceae cyanobacterium C42_A2020_066]
MVSEQNRDGWLVQVPDGRPAHRGRLVLHVNGVASDWAKQLRDVCRLQEMATSQGFDVLGIHNSTENLQADLLECFLARSELWRYTSSQGNGQGQQRLQDYARLVQHLLEQELPPDQDILKALPEAKPGIGSLDLGLLNQLPFLGQLAGTELFTYLYGAYPAGAPRPTLRLAYEWARAIRAGYEVRLVAHSQGTLLVALAGHILDALFQGFPAWAERVYVLGYGPAVLIEELPPILRGHTLLVQDRQDPVAEAFSDVREGEFWTTLQTQLRRSVQQADTLAQLVNRDSHHSASYYLGLQATPASQRAGRLLQELLAQDWSTSPLIQALLGTRLILERPADPGALSPAASGRP